MTIILTSLELPCNPIQKRRQLHVHELHRREFYSSSVQILYKEQRMEVRKKETEEENNLPKTNLRTNCKQNKHPLLLFR